jgi:hypothetical protein
MHKALRRVAADKAKDRNLKLSKHSHWRPV